MFEYEIIEKFQKDELKDGQVFVKYLNPQSHIRVAYVSISVGMNGNSLSCSWYDRSRKIISNQWTIWKNNLNTDGFNEVNQDWNKSWRTHEDNFN